MDAELEFQPQRSLRDHLAAFRRRRQPVLAALAAGLALTAGLALFLPAYYRSTGTILIEQQELPADLVRSTISSYADQRVQTISQRVMTTQNLMDIVRRYDLYADRRKRETREQIMERMRKDIVFKLISADVVDPRSGIPRQATIAFSVSYTSRSTEQAVKVANELATLYLNENVSERTRLTQDASGFLLGESERLARRVEELESKLASFKSQHAAALPELTQLNMQLLDRTEQELRDAQMRQMSLNQQRGYLEAQLAQIKPNSAVLGDDGQRILTPGDRLRMLKSELASVVALYAPTHPDIVRLKREIAGLELQEGAVPASNDLRRQLDAARGELGEVRKKYAPEHPDVQRLERTVQALETELATVPDTPVPPPANPDNPAYIQIKAQLEATQNDLQALGGQIGELRARIADYQRKITVSPDVEKEYRLLTRDYETAQLKYQEVHAKQMEAQVAQNLESDRKGERFTLIEPPLLPEEPVSPNRPVILLLGLIISLGLGVGVAAVLESIDQTVRGRSDILELLAAPPLATVPRIVTQTDLHVLKTRRQLVIGATMAACVAVVLLTHFLYRPLDVLWFAALRRFGF